ncbi:MAG: hypothetical protein GY866_39015 [Proteobacteria bacterium]|nr:hypothetical protein [Pseudomonadota bacterium]
MEFNKEQFTENEWEQVMMTFVMVAREVALADGKIQKAEMKTIVDYLQDKYQYESEFIQAIFNEMPAKFPSLWELLETTLDDRFKAPEASCFEDIEKTMTLVNSKELSNVDIRIYKEILLLFGIRVADAAGRIWGKIDKNEMECLSKLAKLFDLNMNKMLRDFRTK